MSSSWCSLSATAARTRWWGELANERGRPPAVAAWRPRVDFTKQLVLGAPGERRRLVFDDDRIKRLAFAALLEHHDGVGLAGFEPHV